MTITSTPLADRQANLDRAMRITTADPVWREAVIATLSERGSRDALFQRLSLGGNFTIMAMSVLPLAESVPAEVRNNILCLAALAVWADDLADAPAALSWLSGVSGDHRLAGLLARLIANGIPAEAWLARLRAMSEADCLAFAG
jgi:hypothetical protein